MILVFLLIILIGGGIVSLIAGKISSKAPVWVALFTMLTAFFITIQFWVGNPMTELISNQTHWLLEFSRPWIPQVGAAFHLAMDGLSLLMLLLTMVLGTISVVVSWDQITHRTGFFYFNLLWILAGITGVFLAMDLFLFYFFWELMLVPMYFLIGIWGYKDRIKAAYKFFIFTQTGGLLMLLAILGLYFANGQQTGVYSFSIEVLTDAAINPKWTFLLMLGFFIAFMVKLPAVPIHSWLPDAHTEAPTAGSVILAGLLLKTSAYGMIRIVLPIFPQASEAIAPFGMLLGVIGILYGAKLAFAQTDLKRLVAYTSISHMGFVLLGLYAFNTLALQGVVIQMIAHGISTGALFIMAGAIQQRIHSRDIEMMGGLRTSAPIMGNFGILFVMASLGLPGLGNFVAEFLIMLGAYEVNIYATILAALGLIVSSIYGLRILQKVFYGPPKNNKLNDFNVREKLVMSVLAIIIVWIGLFPQLFLDTSAPSIEKTLTPEKKGIKTWSTDGKEGEIQNYYTKTKLHD